MNECVAVIPARGGSKGICDKNLQRLCGHSLISLAVRAALGARYVNRVFVSTDDSRIASVSLSLGANVIVRPEEISGDLASSESALLHALEYMRQTQGLDPELLVFLQCTAPLTLAEDIDGTIDALLSQGADSAVAVTRFHYFLWTKGINGDAVGINHTKDRRLLRQEQNAQFLEAGAVYAMKTAGFLEARHRFFGKTALYEIPPERVFEIDEPIDLKIAEVMLREQQQRRRADKLPERIEALFLDFDGVLTDDRVLVFEDGREAVAASRSDGYGLEQLRSTGIPIVVISKEKNSVVRTRCAKLNLECHQGVDDKQQCLSEILQNRSINKKQVLYLGNDVNDLECMQVVGCSAAPADAHPSVLQVASIVLTKRGGHGAVRELCDLICERFGC